MSDDVWQVGDPAPGTKHSTLGALDPLIGTPRRGPSDLPGFLLARVAEREAKARRAMNGFPTGEWTNDGGIYAGHPMHEVVDHAYGDTAEHIALNDPTFVLAECEANRQVVEAYRDERSRRDVYQRDDAMAVEDEKQRTSRRSSAARTRGLEIALEALALPYADHPDFREEWKA